MSFSLSIDPSLEGRVRLGAVLLHGVTPQSESAVLIEELHDYCARVHDSHIGKTSGDIDTTADARRLYRALGIDPTKTRPSNEALLRRVIKGEALYRVNTLVDCINFASLRFQLPFGLYDRAKIRPPVRLRIGLSGESYEGIRKGPVGLEGRPTLIDSAGPFGNPTSDSARTMITLETEDALVIVYAPGDCDRARIEGVLDWTEGLAVRICGGRGTWREVFI